MQRISYEELKQTANLPSPTGVGLAILRLTQREDYVLGYLSRTIQSDPALTGRLIKLANAKLSGGAVPVCSVEEAVLVLSVGTIKSLAQGFTLISAPQGPAEPGFDHEGYWADSLLCAVAARQLALERGDVDPAAAFTCGLVAGIGRLTLAVAHPEEYGRVVASGAGLSAAGFLAVEQRELGIDHAELAAAALADWRLPEDMVHAVRAFEQASGTVVAPSERAAAMEHVLRGAARLCVAFRESDGFRHLPIEATNSDTTFLSRELTVPPAAVVRVRNRIAAEWNERSRVLQPPSKADVAGALSETAILRQSQLVPQRGMRILAVDDDAVTLKLLAHHLTRDGHRVMLAANGSEALTIALEKRPQMVVTDLTMPEMDGLDLCRALRSSTVCADSYVLVVTGHEEESRIVEAFAAGADEYVNKPFNPKILLARVRAGQRMIELREHVEHDKQELNRRNAQMTILNRQLKTAAMTDVLTELPNRRYAMRRLDEEVAASRAQGQPLSVVLLDLDHFKAVNDLHGHDVGDHVLRETAKALRACTRRNEEVCRLGGEEFLVIAPQSTRDACTHFAERLRQAVAGLEISFGSYAGRVTVSLGVAGLEDGAASVDELLKLADRRAYMAKAAGRNCVVAFGGNDARAESA